jgi:hypothetical protein
MQREPIPGIEKELDSEIRCKIDMRSLSKNYLTSDAESESFL